MGLADRMHEEDIDLELSELLQAADYLDLDKRFIQDLFKMCSRGVSFDNVGPML